MYKSWKDVWRGDLTNHIHLEDLAGAVEMDRLVYYDKYAVGAITDLENAIELIKEYRQDLAKIAQQLTQKPFTLELRIKRRIMTDHRKIYYVGLYRKYDTGETTESEQSFPGTERSKALKLYAQLLKAHPGISVVKDIEKSKWEH